MHHPITSNQFLMLLQGLACLQCALMATRLCGFSCCLAHDMQRFNMLATALIVLRACMCTVSFQGPCCQACA